MSVVGPGGMVRTVRGPVDPAALGITTMHEHLWMDSTPLLAVHGYETTAAGPWDAATAAEARWNPGVHTDNYRLTDVDTAIEELAPFARAGGGTIVELTPPSLGQDARRVLEIAERSGLHVVIGTGQYLGPVHEPWVALSSVDEIDDAPPPDRGRGHRGDGDPAGHLRRDRHVRSGRAGRDPVPARGGCGRRRQWPGDLRPPPPLGARRRARPRRPDRGRCRSRRG